MQKILVKVHNNNAVIERLTVDTRSDGVKKLQAGEAVNYELMDEKTGRAPQHLITKRVNEDLHLSFDPKGEQTGLIIEGFYGNSEQALIGFAEDSNYYYYIPDTGEAVDYVTQLVTGDIEGQALGGPAQISPWWTGGDHQGGEAIWPWLVGLGVLGAAGYVLAEEYMSSKDEESARNNRADAPTVRFDTLDGTEESERVVLIEPGGDNVSLTIGYIDTTNSPQTIVVKKGDDGVWVSTETLPTGVMVDASTGAVTIRDGVIDDVSQLIAVGRDGSNNKATAEELVDDAELATEAENDMAADAVLMTQLFSDTVSSFDSTEQASDVNLFIPEMVSATFADEVKSSDSSPHNRNGNRSDVAIDALIDDHMSGDMNDYMDAPVFLSEDSEQVSIVVPVSASTSVSTSRVDDVASVSGIEDGNHDSEFMDFFVSSEVSSNVSSNVSSDAANISTISPDAPFATGENNSDRLNPDTLNDVFANESSNKVVMSDLFASHHQLIHTHIDSTIEPTIESTVTEDSVVIATENNTEFASHELALQDVYAGVNDHFAIDAIDTASMLSGDLSMSAYDELTQLDVMIPII